MRASARPFSTRLFVWTASLTALAAGFVACADSIHLDPPDGGTSTGTGTGATTSTTSQGTGGAGECSSNKDCAYPEPVCDTVKRKCLECVTHEDCVVKPGTVCSAGSCVCPTEGDAAKQDFCPAVNDALARCVDRQTSATDCGACGRTCFGACTGGACAGRWTRVTTPNSLAGRSHHVAVATNDGRMIVWGGQTNGGAVRGGAIYDPATTAWKTMDITGAPKARTEATAIWDNAHGVMIVWGGLDANGAPLDDGGRYDPRTDTWSPITKTGAPTARSAHSAVWATNVGMIVWGGQGAAPTDVFDDGGTYDPVTDTWTPLTSNNGMNKRKQHVAVWLDAFKPMPLKEPTTVKPSMLVFGGIGPDSTATDVYYGDGWSVDAVGTWTPFDTPSITIAARARHTAVATDKGMIVWGGVNQTSTLADGASVDQNQAWAAVGGSSSSGEAVDPRFGHTAVVLGTQMIIFGGTSDSAGQQYLDSAWSLDTGTLTWSRLTDAGPSRRTHHTAVAVGTKMIVFGGMGPNGLLADGAVYDTAP